MKRRVLLLAILLAALATPARAFTGDAVTADPLISLDQSDPHLGDLVTFTTSGIPKNVHRPRIEVLCYQDNALVFGMAGGVDYAFRLGAGTDCTANLFYFGKEQGEQVYVLLASTSFHAEG